MSVHLLIEPVWNRNLPDTANETPVIPLLIEPVWNRNVRTRRFHQRRIILLIEPVWNRNSVGSVIHCCAVWTFNRTSLESKPSLHSLARYW